MLEKIKLLLGITDASKDTLLETLLALATEEANEYMHNPSAMDKVEGIICQMVVYKYNRLGTEGATSEGYSGVSYSYTEDYPPHIYRELRKYRKVGVIHD